MPTIGRPKYGSNGPKTKIKQYSWDNYIFLNDSSLKVTENCRTCIATCELVNSFVQKVRFPYFHCTHNFKTLMHSRILLRIYTVTDAYIKYLESPSPRLLSVNNHSSTLENNVTNINIMEQMKIIKSNQWFLNQCNYIVCHKSQEGAND